MKEFLITDLAKIIKAHPVAIRNSQAHPKRSRRDTIRTFDGVSIDSRTVRPGQCFFAISGDNFDGHDYIADAFAKGAACAVVSRDIDTEKFAGYTLLKVDDTIKSLGEFARQYRQQANFKVVAITGSAGKTTTRQIAYHVLSQHYRVYQAPKNFNNNIGLPLTLLGAEADDEIVLAELGSNHPGEIAYLSRIAQPDIAVITNVYPAHLAGFGNLETIRAEKLSISEPLRSEGVLIINTDVANRAVSDKLAAARHRVITFGKSDISYDRLGSRFTIDDTDIFLPLIGPGNVENALAAWSVCSRFGLAISDFAEAVMTLPAIPMRTELLQIGTLTVLNDCYNANPASMKNALDILACLGPSRQGRLVFICADMAELGRQSQALHAELGSFIAQAKVRLLLTVGRFARITAARAQRDAEYDLKIKSFDDTISACNNLQDFIKDYDIILVKGSRAAGLEIVVDELRKLFSPSVSCES